MVGLGQATPVPLLRQIAARGGMVDVVKKAGQKGIVEWMKSAEIRVHQKTLERVVVWGPTRRIPILWLWITPESGRRCLTTGIRKPCKFRFRAEERRRTNRFMNSLGRGRKQCPACKAVVGARTRTCECGHEFAVKSRLSGALVTKNITGYTVTQVLDAIDLIREFLRSNPKLSTDELMRANKSIDLNKVLSSEMKPEEIQAVLGAKERNDAAAKVFTLFTKSEINELLTRAQQLMCSE